MCCRDHPSTNSGKGKMFNSYVLNSLNRYQYVLHTENSDPRIGIVIRRGMFLGLQWGDTDGTTNVINRIR